MVYDRAHPCDGIYCGQRRSPIRPVPMIQSACDAPVLRDPVPCAHQRRGPLIEETGPLGRAEIDGLDILEKEAERGVNDILEGSRSIPFVFPTSQKNRREGGRRHQDGGQGRHGSLSHVIHGAYRKGIGLPVRQVSKTIGEASCHDRGLGYTVQRGRHTIRHCAFCGIP